MLKAIAHNAVLIGSLVVGATLTGMTASLVMAPNGALGPAFLQAASVPSALLAMVLSVIVATALAMVVGRVINTVVGLFVFGGALFGLAWRLDTVEQIAIDGSLGLVALETVLWALVVGAAVIAVFAVAGPLRDVEPDRHGLHPDRFRSVDALKSFAAGALVLPAVWFVAQTTVKGQVLGAVFCGAMIAGLAGRLLAPSVQPVLLFAAPIVFGAIGHVVGLVMLGSTPPVDAWVDGTIPALIRPMPVDYAAASVMGVAVGIGWAKSFLHHSEEHEEEGKGTAQVAV